MRKFLLLTLLLLLPGLALAQGTTTGTVTGTVVDEEGNPVSGAKLTFVSSALLGERATESDDQGQFRVPLLPPGPYAVSVALGGQRVGQYTFRLRLGEVFPLDIQLQERLVEEVTVYGSTGKMQTTAQGENFEYATQVEELPIQARTLETVGLLAPNISYGPTGTRDTVSLAISGAPSMDTIVLLDGAEISDPLFGSGTNVYFEDALQELQVMTSGVSAKYGRFTGGVLNAVTKGGSNDFAATLRVELDREDWNGKTPFNESQASELNETNWLTTSGRIVRDHLWYFGGGRKIPSSSTASTVGNTGESYTTNREEDRWQLRLTGAINPNHTFDVSHLEFDSTNTGRAALPPGEGRAIGNRADPREMDTLAYQGVLTPNLFLDLKATKKDVAIQSGGDPAQGSPFIDWNTFEVYNNHWWDFEDANLRNNETMAANFTQIFNTAGTGTHSLEYGAQFVDSETGGENRQSVSGFNFISRDVNFCFDAGNAQPCNVTVGGGGTVAPADVMFTIDGTQDNRRLRALNLGGNQNIENLALYVQDSWQINDEWRIDAGIRWDDYDGSGPLAEFNVAYDTLAPRIAVTHNLNDDWQVTGAFGIYTGRLNDNWVQAATNVGNAPGIDYQYTGPTLGVVDRATVESVVNDTNAACLAQPSGSCWDGVLNVSDPNQPTTFIADGIKSPEARDLSFTLRRALPRNSGTLTFTYSDRQFTGLVDDFVGIADSGIGQITITDPFPPGTATFPADASLWSNNPAAKRKYQGFAVTADYRPSATWSVGGNYTLSETTGNYEGEGQNTPGEGSPLGDYSTTRSEDSASPFGFLDEDLRHRINVWGNYRFDFGRAGALVFGGIAQYASGRAYSTTATSPTGVDPANCCAPSSFTQFFGGRGQSRFEGAWNLDLSTRYQAQIWKELDTWAKISVVNVTNEDGLISANTAGSSVVNGVTGVREFVPGGNFLQADTDTDYQRPREYLVTIGIGW